MKRCFIKHLLAAAALLSASAARADWFSYDGLYYDTLDETTCEVSDNKWHSGTASIPEQVTKTVTVIYDNAFYGSGVEWITIEDGENPIEFKTGGSSMTRVFDDVPVKNAYIGRDFIFPGGPSWKTNPPFSWNDALQIVEIGDLVTSIPSCSFNEIS